jgi:hypothetical protein
MRMRRILIGCGALLLLAMMLVCAFSLGVSLGERGVTRAVQTQAARQPQGLPSAIGGPPNVIGTVLRYGDNTLTLTTAQGPKTIGLNAQTTVRYENAPAQMSDLRPGVALAVWGDPSDGGRVLVARVILILTK